MEKFIGPFAMYAGVVVEYLEDGSKKVFFDYRDGDNTLVSVFLMSFLFFTLPFTVLFLLLSDYLFLGTPYIEAISSAGVLIVLFVVPLVFVVNKKLSSEVLPKFPYYIFWFGKRRKKIDCLHEDTFTIPDFQNIFLEYEAVGRFGKLLRKIEISKYKDDVRRTHWKAVFYFSEVPKEGYLKVGYI